MLEVVEFDRPLVWRLQIFPAIEPNAVLYALDGATFDVIEPMVAEGELPNLAAWMQAGQHAPLPSTIPPVTFPAWSSFMTGLEPADHGIFDFTQKREGQYLSLIHI